MKGVESDVPLPCRHALFALSLKAAVIMKKYILSTLLFASTMLLLTPVTLAEEI